MDPENDDTTIPDDVLNPEGQDAPAEEPSLDEALAESLDRAIEDEPATGDEPSDAPKAEGAEAEGTDDPGKAPEAAKPDAKPDDKPAEGEQPPAAEQDAETEAEIASLGLKEKSAARFREMASEIKELAPIREQLKAAGVENVADLPTIVERSRQAQDMISMVMDTGASPDQYGQTLDYLKVANAAARGDAKAAEQALQMAMSEVAVWAKALGREVPGVHDPLAEHADLQAGIAGGEITREHALELAAARERTQNLQQHQQQTQQSQQEQAAQQQALAGLMHFDRQMAQDPNYAAKRPMLNAMVTNIRATLPPHQWLQATQQAYASIPDVPAPLPAAPAAPPAPAAPAPSAIRPGGPRGSLAPQKFDSVEDALDFAIDGPASR